METVEHNIQLVQHASALRRQKVARLSSLRSCEMQGDRGSEISAICVAVLPMAVLLSSWRTERPLLRTNPISLRGTAL